MSMFNNPFVKFCTSGLGTGTDAGKAVGYSLLICGIAFVGIYYVGKGCYNLVKKAKATKEQPPQ